MTAVLIPLPRTGGGRALLRDTLRTVRHADTRLFVATAFDWDGEAEMEREAETTQAPREATP